MIAIRLHYRMVANKAENWMPLPMARFFDHCTLQVKEAFHRANATGNPDHFVRGASVDSSRQLGLLHHVNAAAVREGLKLIDFAYFGGYDYSFARGNADFGIQPVSEIIMAAARIRQGEFWTLIDIYNQTGIHFPRMPLVVDGETMDNDTYRAIQAGRMSAELGINVHIEDQKGNDGFDLLGGGRSCGNYTENAKGDARLKPLVKPDLHQSSLAAFDHGVQTHLSYDPAVAAVLMLPVDLFERMMNEELPHLAEHYKVELQALLSDYNPKAHEMLVRQLMSPMKIARFDDLKGIFADGKKGGKETAAQAALAIQELGLADMLWVEMSLESAADWNAQIADVVNAFRRAGVELPIMTNLSPNAFNIGKSQKHFGVRSTLSDSLKGLVLEAIEKSGGNSRLSKALLAHLEAGFSAKPHPISEAFLTNAGIAGGFSTFGPAQAAEFGYSDFLHSWVRVHNDYFEALHRSQAHILGSDAQDVGSFTKLSQSSRTRPWEVFRVQLAARLRRG